MGEEVKVNNIIFIFPFSFLSLSTMNHQMNHPRSEIYSSLNYFLNFGLPSGLIVIAGIIYVILKCLTFRPKPRISRKRDFTIKQEEEDKNLEILHNRTEAWMKKLPKK